VPDREEAVQIPFSDGNMGIYDDLRALAKERRPDILEQLKNF
jgi:hypothetical protein